LGDGHEQREVPMKKVLLVLVVFGLGVGVGSFLDRKAPVAEAGQEPGCAPLLMTASGAVIQDMNGDGVFDPIAEALRLLNWAFLGAPAPVPPCVGGGPAGLPDTGQATCYGLVEGQLWVPVPCGEAACAGQDGAYATGCPSEDRFVVNDAGTPEDTADDTVTDTCTGLMWQKETGNNGNGLNWCDALAYCENLSFAGHDDWRLPNVRELQSIVDYGRINPSIDPVFGALSSFYWSSTSFAAGPDFAWFVEFHDGSVGIDGKDFSIYFRAVRSGP
jgi:hypothetical protein